MTNLLRAIFTHPPLSRPPLDRPRQAANRVGGRIMRALNLRAESFKKQGGAATCCGVDQSRPDPVQSTDCRRLGQNGYWLSTAASLAQLNFVQSVTQVANLSVIEETAGPSRVAVLGEMLGIDSWTPRTDALLQHVRDDFTQLVPLALVAPETITN